MARYFDKFPTIDYNGTPAKNILARVDFTPEAKRDVYSNFDYTIEDGVSRPDVLSYGYYNNSYYDWLIYLSNGVIDPYHDYYKEPGDFNSYIVAKYGSLSQARNKILYYRNAWSSDESTISVSTYDALSASIKKYWTSVVDVNGVVTGYSRLKTDWIVSTNKIVELTVASVAGYSVNDKVTQGAAEAFVAKVDSTNSILIVQHVTGAFTTGTLGTTTITKVNTIQTNIAEAEAAFWEQVSAYEYEEESNELKRYINLIRAEYVPDIEKMFLKAIKR